ncbi:MAG: hypothetical protein RL637_1770 [Pseudomonadota bacterium]
MNPNHFTLENQRPLSRPRRSAWTVTLQTWEALFLREAQNRLSGGKESLWILLDPIWNMSILLFVFTVIRGRVVIGMDITIWIMTGILTYALFKGTMMQGMNAITPNRGLFIYRQIKPMDLILIRGFMEAFLTIIITLILFSGAGLLRLPIIPTDPLTILLSGFSLWAIGLGAAMTTTIATHFIPGMGKIITFLMMPLYVTSGVIFPVATLPLPYREWILINPMLHGVESARQAFSPYYHGVYGINLAYPYTIALIFIFLGLGLQRRFGQHLTDKP